MRELDGLENNFSERIVAIKTLEEYTAKRIARLRKILTSGVTDGQWARQLPQMIDALTEVQRSIEQMKNLSLPDEEVVFEDVENISDEDVLS